MKKTVALILGGLLLLLLVAQFIRPEKNLSGTDQFALSNRYPVPEPVAAILEVACNDCHTNSTRYPWYAEVQPIAGWIAHHIEEGKEHLNFSEFTSRPIAVQNHKFEEIIETVKEGEMPLNSYTWIHQDAALTQEQREVLVSWAGAMMDTLKNQYPADSLVLKRRR